MTAEKDSGCTNRNASKFSGASCLEAHNTPHHFSRSLTPVVGSWGKCRNGECQIEPPTRIGFPPMPTTHQPDTTYSSRNTKTMPQPTYGYFPITSVHRDDLEGL